jgi:hypothetical protein
MGQEDWLPQINKNQISKVTIPLHSFSDAQDEVHTPDITAVRW